VALDQTLAGKRLGDNDSLEMLAIAFDFNVTASKAGGDVIFDEFWSRKHGVIFKKRVQ
jgi:hypothetical protein